MGPAGEKRDLEKGGPLKSFKGFKLANGLFSPQDL
jgi:hypothetical protein